jgi:outer membrane protein OmpA-like peptidoglycan-associated protein
VTIVLSTLLLFAIGAHAAGATAMSTDIELLKPAFSFGSLPGVENAWIARKGTLRAGLLFQVETDPLLLFSYGQEAGSVIEQRSTVDFGASYSFSNAGSLRVLLPMMVQTGTEVPDFSAGGLGLGDLDLGLRLRVADVGSLTTSVRADLSLPTGREEAWMGEGGFRPSFGFLASLDRPSFRILADTGLLVRPREPTDQDLTFGSELVLDGAVSWKAWPDHVELWTGLLTRGQVPRLWMGGGENAVEWESGLQGSTSRGVTWNFGLGKGIADGVGSCGLRAFAGLVFSKKPAQRPPEVVVVQRAPEPQVEQDLPEKAVVETDVDWEDGELSRVRGTEILIREPVQFEFGTAHVLPQSVPVLHAVARVMNDYWQIAHVVVEGHASEEGSFAYNFDLSVRRAEAIYQELIRAGVDQERLSFRGMGEVQPTEAGKSADKVSANRRVVFRIVQLLDPRDPRPTYAGETVVPWTGERMPIPKPGSAVLDVARPVTEGVEGQDAASKDLLEDYFEKAVDPGGNAAAPPVSPPPPPPAPDPAQDEEEP